MSYIPRNHLVYVVWDRLAQADDYVARPDAAPWSHPCFRSCRQAALNVLRVYPDAQHVLVMPDDCLSPMRVETLLANRTLIVPAHDGKRLVSIPKSALRTTRSGQHALYIENLLKEGAAYAGPVDLTVVACLAFNVSMRRLYSFEYRRTADVIQTLCGSQIITPAGGARVPVVLLASDAQQIAGWPDYALGSHEADIVITATRAVVLGSGVTRPFAVAEGPQTERSGTLV